MDNLNEKWISQIPLSPEDVMFNVGILLGIMEGFPADRLYDDLTGVMNDFYARSGLKDSDPFHRLVMAEMLERFDSRKAPLVLPDSVEALYQTELARIRKGLADPEYKFHWRNNVFAKDLAILRSHLIPAGPGLLEISGVPRRLLVAEGPGQFFRLARMLLGRLGGRRPLLAFHLHEPNLSQFSPEGWDKAYFIAAELLELNPHLRGLMRHAWFFDPAVSKISPRLAYLRDIPLAHGAETFYGGRRGADSGALRRSPTRQRLHREGSYNPKIYYLLWPREALIAYGKGLSGSK